MHPWFASVLKCTFYKNITGFFSPFNLAQSQRCRAELHVMEETQLVLQQQKAEESLTLLFCTDILIKIPFLFKLRFVSQGGSNFD